MHRTFKAPTEKALNNLPKKALLPCNVESISAYLVLQGLYLTPTSNKFTQD